jgi:N-acetylglucosaminyldiphosphoundecaprenol N-acetyl-beta-D-mannosaminyltransferase
VDVLGVHVSATTMAKAVDEIGSWVEQRHPTYVCVTGVHGVMECVRDEALREVHNRSGLTTTDGMPLVWSCRAAGVRGTERVYGPDLMTSVLERAAAQGWRSFFYGGAPGVAELLADRLTARYAGLQVVGTYSPPYRPLTPEEEDDCAVMINESGADLVWVGLSTPKQERWMAAMRPRLQAPVLFGVGAAFDIHAGLLRQAPPWLQANGLEWAFRLAVEPRRLWRRYLRNNPAFVMRLLRRPPRIATLP